MNIRDHLEHDFGYRWLGWEHHKVSWEEVDGKITFEVGKQIDVDGLTSEIYCYQCGVVLVENADGHDQVNWSL